MNLDGLCQKPRLLEHLQQLKQCKLLVRHHPKYIKDILLPLCQTTVDDDVAALAVACLPKYVLILPFLVWILLIASPPTNRWMGCIELQKDMAEQQHRAIVDVSKDVLHNIKADVQQIHNARFKLCTSSSSPSSSSNTYIFFFVRFEGNLPDLRSFKGQ